MKYAVIIRKTSTGFSADVPDLPGCIAASATLKETRKLISEAIQFHLEGLKLSGKKIPKPITKAGMLLV